MRKPTSHRRTCDLAVALTLGMGLFSPAFGQDRSYSNSQPTGDLWRSRTGSDYGQPTPSQRESDWGWNQPVASSSTPQDVKWKPANQLPASPWDRSEPSRAAPPNSASAYTVQERNDSYSQPTPAYRASSANMIRQPHGNGRSSEQTDYQAAGRPVAPPSQQAFPASTVAYPIRQVEGVVAGASQYQIEATQPAVAPNPTPPVVAEVNPYTSVEANPYSSVVTAASMAEFEADETRKRFAGRVSAELLRDSRTPLAAPPLPVELPAGWKNIEEELRTRLTRCDEYLRRNAVLSARDEVLSGLRTLIRTVDLRTGTWNGEPAFDRALTAFEEEADFHESIRNPAHGASTQTIVARHTTPVLKQVELETVSPELAAQHYRNYARQQLQQATQNHPWSADLLFAFGKTLERRGESAPEESSRWRNQAVVCYEAALSVAPGHGGSANQLGYVLLKLDRVDEAQIALNRSLQTRPTADAWRNIAEVYRRRGQNSQAEYAVSQASAIQGTQPTIPEVVNLDPQTFIGISPNHFVGPAAAASPITAPATIPQTASKAGWFGKWWK